MVCPACIINAITTNIPVLGVLLMGLLKLQNVPTRSKTNLKLNQKREQTLQPNTDDD